MNPVNHPGFARFWQTVERQLEKGRVEYGDRSLRRPSVDLLDEVQQEFVDAAAWAMLGWLRLESAREAARACEQ